MLIYKLYQFEGDLIIYQYYSRIADTAGLVSINKNTGETAVIRQSDDDFGCRMAYKMVGCLADFYAENAYKEAGTIAWH